MSLISRPRQTTPATQTPAISGLEVRPLSATEWRVRDTTVPESDGSSVIGIVQQIGQTFEATQIGAPLARYYFGSLEDAVTYLGHR